MIAQLTGKKGWPLIGVVEMRELMSGPTGRESIFYKIHKKYGPAVRLGSIGEILYHLTFTNPVHISSMIPSFQRQRICRLALWLDQSLTF